MRHCSPTMFDKTIIPFKVHNGSRFSGTIDTIKELEPDATVIEDGFTVSEQDVANAAEDVTEWLNGLALRILALGIAEFLKFCGRMRKKH